MIPFVLSEWGILPNAKYFTIAFVLNPFVGPTLAAYIMNRITEGPEGVLRLRRRLTQWRTNWKWYVFSLLGIPAAVLLGIFVLPGARASFHGLPASFLVSYPINFVVIFFLGGPLGEEIGWRGFALPRMQSHYGPLWGTLLLGLLWTGWHLPHFLTSAQRGGPGTSFATFLTNFSIFFLMVMAITVIFTWVFNHTQGSLFMAILLHASINALGSLMLLFPVPIVTNTDLALLIGFGVLAGLIVILTRGQLGYQPSQEQPLSSGKIEAQPIFSLGPSHG
ncbi:type II CAAX endopeptidase family protein [soil metagenome]